MPDSCVNTALPTMLLPAATGRPEARATSCEISGSARVSTPHSLPIQVARGHHHLFQRRVAGAFAQAVDGGAGMRGAGAQRGQRVGSGQAEVVVGVDLDADVDFAPQRGDALVRAEGFQQPQRVGIRARGWRRAACATCAAWARKAGSARDASSKPTLTWLPASATRHTPRGDGVQHPGAALAQLALDLDVGHADPPGARVSAWQGSAASMSASARRAQTMVRACFTLPVMARISATSCAPIAGTPTSISGTPAASSAAAMASFSSSVKATPAVCSPSRSVVSLMIERRRGHQGLRLG